MKEITDDLQHSVGLLEGTISLCDVIDNHICQQTLVRCRKICFRFEVHMELFPPGFFSPFCQAEKNAFFVADLGVVMRQHVRWRTHMARIRPYYPVRCNSSPTVIDVLAALGTGFICTNKVFSHAYLQLWVQVVFSCFLKHRQKRHLVASKPQYHVFFISWISRAISVATKMCTASPFFKKSLILSCLCLFQTELELVQSRGVPSEDIIFSGVSKQLSQMKYAAKNGVNLLVCDNEVELCKISRCHPNAKYVLIMILTLLMWLESYSFYHYRAKPVCLLTCEPVFLCSGCCYRFLQKQFAMTMTWQWPLAAPSRTAGTSWRGPRSWVCRWLESGESWQKMHRTSGLLGRSISVEDHSRRLGIRSVKYVCSHD